MLAPRLRVEERLLIQAFAARGQDAQLLDPSKLSVSLTGENPTLPAVVLDRGVATPAGVTLGALLAANGAAVVNRTATTRLLADRLALVRHLVIAGVPVPKTIIAFGEEQALEAIEQVGYPAMLLSAQVDPGMADAVVHDRDAAEAIIEHRAMLGRERMVLAQEYVGGRSLSVVIVGTEIVACDGVEQVPIAVSSIVEQVIGRLGSGVYAVKIVESQPGPVVVAATNLTDFRALQDAGHDVAGRIADFTLSQVPQAQRDADRQGQHA
jgi:[lysine-biosynthesis-protein LysW]--L-2-aminoadipate ligase